MSEPAKTPSKNLPREAFYTDGIKATILDHLQYLPQEFSIKFLTAYLASLAEKPFADDEIASLTDRARRAMKTWKKAGKVEIHHEPTQSNNLLTHYTKK